MNNQVKLLQGKLGIEAYTDKFIVMHGLTVLSPENRNVNYMVSLEQPKLSRLTGLIYFNEGFLAPNDYEIDDCLDFEFSDSQAVSDMLHYGLYNEDGEDRELTYGQQLLADYFIHYKYLSLEDPEHIHAMIIALRGLIWHYTDDEAQKFKDTHMKFFLMLDYLANYEQDVGSISFYTYCELNPFIHNDRLYLTNNLELSIPLIKDHNGNYTIENAFNYLNDVDDVAEYDGDLEKYTTITAVDLSNPEFREVVITLDYDYE